MNPPATTPDEVLAGVATEPLDEILRQIVNGYFVLTDGNGAVSKWSEPAELLFGLAAEDILGEGFFEKLITGTLPPGGEAWRAFLDAGEPPRAPGTVQLTGRIADGGEFPMEAVFVPVKLDEGFDFSLFLEDLSFDLPLNLMLMRMRQQHPVVVRALKSGIEPEAQPWEGWRTAGTLVVFKPLQPTPWVEAELARRDAERAAADAEAEERLTNTDPGIQGSVNDLDDAAAVVARLLSALERIDDLERVAGGLPAQLEDARKESERGFETLRGDVQRALSSIPSQLDTAEQAARVERLERARAEAEEAEAERRRALAAAESAAARLNARIDQLERDAAAGVSDARLAEAVAAAEARATESIAALETRLAASDGPSDRLERVRAEHEEAVAAVRAELAETVERLQREREREVQDARAELTAALQTVEHVQRDAQALREQLSEVTVDRAAAAADRRRLEELQTETDQLRARVEGLDASEAIARHDAALQELAELVELPGVVAQLREAVDARPAGADDATAAAIADLRIAVARADAAVAEIDALREAVVRHDATAADVEALRAAHEAATAELREALAAPAAPAAELDELREAVARHEAATAEIAALVASHASTEAELSALRGLVAGHEAATAELREALAAPAATPADLEELRAALARHEGTGAEIAELRRQLTELRDRALAADNEDAGLPRGEVDALVGDTQRQIDALSARLDSLAVRDDVSAELSELRGRVDEDLHTLRVRLEDLDARGELDALAARLDGLAARDELAGLVSRDDLRELHARLDGVPARDELVEGLVRRDELGGFAARDDVDALRERLDRTAARDEIDALHGRFEGLAARDELESLRARLDDLALPREADDDVTGRLEALEGRISAVDKGAGTVLSDVRALKSRIDEALSLARTAHETGRAEGEELHELVARLSGEVEVARGALERAESEALGARQAASVADQAAAAAREDAAGAREDAAAARREADTGRERVTQLAEQVERLEESRGETRGLGERLTAVDQRAAALSSELGAGRERLEALDARVERLGETVTESAEARRAGDERAAALRTEIGQVRDVADSADSGLRALRDELGRMQEEIAGVRDETRRGSDAIRAEITAARDEARKADQRVEAMQSELAYALASLDELKQGLSSAGQAAVIARREAEQARKAAQTAGDGSTERVTEVFQQILGLAAARNNPGRPRRDAVAPARPAEPAKREPRHGFDDVATPMAILALDGKFKELNPAFTKLVGYQEHEFAKAAWPSPHDRRDYKDQLEQLSQIGKGELREIEVQSTYMHGQGLMVPVVGKLSVVAGEDGLPSHLVLEAEDRHHG